MKSEKGVDSTSMGQDHSTVATKCSACGECWYPARARCPRCLSVDLQEYELAEEGVVYASTCVRVGSGPDFAPYVLSYVDFQEGLRVLFRRDPEDLVEPFEPGEPVRRTEYGTVTSLKTSIEADNETRRIQ